MSRKKKSPKAGKKSASSGDIDLAALRKFIKQSKSVEKMDVLAVYFGGTNPSDVTGSCRRCLSLC